jgi:type VI secretion system protein VasD
MTSRRALLVGPVVLLAARCGKSPPPPPPPPPPPTLELSIACGPNVNPNDAGAAAPVAVRLFFLTADARFQRSDVFALTDREKATLAEEETSSEEIMVRPNEHRTVKSELAKGVRFLGVAVLFRDIDRAQWRAVAPLTASGPNRLTLKIDGIEVSLAPS